MLRFAKSATLEAHLRRVAPLGNDLVQFGDVLYYVLVEQPHQHVTTFTTKDLGCRGYVKSYLRHNDTNEEEGGPPGQRYLLEYRHFCEKVKLLRGALLLYRNNKSVVCLSRWQEQKRIRNVPLRSYPGSVADFENAVGAPLPPLTCRVTGRLWRAACRCLKAFTKPEANLDVLARSNEPLLLQSKGEELTLSGSYRGQLQTPIVCRLKTVGQLTPEPTTVPLSGKFIQRLVLAGGDVVELGYADGVFGLRSADLECTSLTQKTEEYICQLHSLFIDKLELVAERFVRVGETQEAVLSSKPEAVNGDSLCLLESEDGNLHLFPETNLYGEDDTLVLVQPHPGNRGKWQPVLVMYEYLAAAWQVLAQFLFQLQLPVDLQPLGSFALLKRSEQYVLRMGIDSSEASLWIYLRVVPAMQAPDVLDINE